jgi:hypothetical protein
MLGFLLLVATLSVNAFPQGAGSCRQGQAAVHGNHLRRSNVTTGQLSEGGFQMHLNDVSLSILQPKEFEVGIYHNLSLVALDGRFFRGFLLRLNDGLEGALEPDSDDIQIANICREVPGVTHTNRDVKKLVSTSLMVPVGDVDVTMRLDVTVVVRNVFGDSEYYYSRYNLRSSQSACASLGGACSTAPDCCSEICESGHCFATPSFGMRMSMAGGAGQKLGSGRGGAGGGNRRRLGVRG